MATTITHGRLVRESTVKKAAKYAKVFFPTLTYHLDTRQMDERELDAYNTYMTQKVDQYLKNYLRGDLEVEDDRLLATSPEIKAFIKPEITDLGLLHHHILIEVIVDRIEKPNGLPARPRVNYAAMRANIRRLIGEDGPVANLHFEEVKSNSIDNLLRYMTKQD